ncbi:5' nucleotidase, NT5C type [Oceanobacillus bengalensis]|uniref:Nucleotidase n=1 Tax=Oceanobacillus bengalensis TaxID=1435466 RepID=A0A494YU91_9BACI|nr:HAD family acid phosphatase [Oceanobacillus bengalensis]RKQ13667.1 hypothetical protein D8M05_15560 [Oceanobacillus bengalensis]
MRFGFDIDDTLINLREHAFHIYNHKLHKNIGLDIFMQIGRVEIHEPFGLSDEEGKEMWNNSLEEIYYTNCPAFPHAIETLQMLDKAGHSIFYITARPKEHGERTKEWMKQKGFPVNDARFFYGMKDEEKIDIIKDLHLDYYVDDKPTILKTLTKEPIHLLLKDQPYNRDIDDYERMINWKDFAKLIKTES